MDHGKSQISISFLIHRSSEGSSSQEQLASESSTPEQPNATEYSLNKENITTDNCTQPEIIIQNNNHIEEKAEEGETNISKIGDQVTKYDSSGTSSTVERQSAVNDIDDMKRAHARQLIERYFYQLSSGCGNSHCTNNNCASNGQFETLTPNQAAARAIQLFSEDAKFCDYGGNANKAARITAADQTDSGCEPIAANSQTIGDDDAFDDVHR